MLLILKKSHVFFFLIVFLLTFSKVGQAQYSFGSSFGNYVTSFPVLGYGQLFTSNFHPGVDIFFKYQFNSSDKNRWLLRFNTLLLYHRFVQTLNIYRTAIEYNRTLGSRWIMDAGLGLGYGLAFTNAAVAKLNENGEYEVRSSAIPRSQFIISLRLGTSYALSDKPECARLTAGFKTLLQGPFVKGYVPLLPINAFEIGLLIPIKNKEK